jgi:hypothetical protein
MNEKNTMNEKNIMTILHNEEISNSKFSDFLNCPMYGHYSWDLNIKPKQQGLALIYGSALHAAIAAYFKGQDMRKSIEAFDAIWSPNSNGRFDAKRNPKNGLAIILELYRQKPNRDNVIAVEAPFLIPLIDNLIWTGIIDLLENMAGYLVVTDHKSTSYLNDGFWAPYNAQAEYQPIGYMMATQLIFQESCQMYSINAFSVTKDPKTIFERRFFSVNQKDIEEFPFLVSSYWKIINQFRNDRKWPKNGKYCNRWGTCQYMPLCSFQGIDFSKEENLDRLPADYIIEPWDNIAGLRM